MQNPRRKLLSDETGEGDEGHDGELGRQQIVAAGVFGVDRFADAVAAECGRKEARVQTGRETVFCGAVLRFKTDQQGVPHAAVGQPFPAVAVQAADGVVRSEAEPLPAGVADCEAHGVGIAGVKGVFGVHGEECGGCRAAFGRGRIGDGAGIESCEADPAAVVHAAAEAGFHRRIGTQQMYLDAAVGLVAPRRREGFGEQVVGMRGQPPYDAVLQCAQLLVGSARAYRREDGEERQGERQAFHGGRVWLRYGPELFDHHVEPVAGAGAVRQMFGKRRDAEQGRVGAHLDRPAVGQEFEDAQPAVAAVALPAAAEDLDVEHHLVDVMSRAVFVDAVGNGVLVVARLARVAADDHTDVRGGFDQFAPDFGAGVARGEFVAVLFDPFGGAFVQEGVGHEYHLAVAVFGLVDQRRRPVEHFVAGQELRGDDEQAAPCRIVEGEGGVFQRDGAVAVGIRRDADVAPRRIAFEGEVIGETRAAVFGLAVSVVVVARRDDVGDLAVEPCQCVRGRLPHLAAGLVEHLAVQNDVFVLFDQIARAEHGLDVEVVDVVGDPRRAEVEQRLVDVVFGIALRVAQQDHGKRIGIGEFLTVGAVLRLSGEGDERRHAAEK